MHRDAPNSDSLPPEIRRLIADGDAGPASRGLAEVLREITWPAGAATAEGTRALQEQRGERA